MLNRMQTDRMTTLDGVPIRRRCHFRPAKTNPFTSIDDGLSAPSPLAQGYALRFLRRRLVSSSTSSSVQSFSNSFRSSV